MGSIAEPDAWAREASSLPLAFAQVREDARLDVLLLKKLPPHRRRVLMIASGGDTAVRLVCEQQGADQLLELVDANAAQLALTKAKFHLACHAHPPERLQLLGHAALETSTRGAAWLDLLDKLNFTIDIFGPMALISQHGPDYAGRYEVAFRELSYLLKTSAAQVETFISYTESSDALRHLQSDTTTGQAFATAFASALSLPNLVALFGKGATQNPRRPFHEHFLAQLQAWVTHQAPRGNPFIRQMLLPASQADSYADWLELPQLDPQTLPCITYHHSTMLQHLEQTSRESIDFLHLSNILDWLSISEAQTTLQAAQNVLRPGGYLIIRQLNSSLDLPSLLAELGSLKQLDELSNNLTISDRSFFYPAIHVAQRS